MIIQTGVPTLPTTTVALDLFTRTGLANQYSLSPIKGRATMTYRKSDKKDLLSRMRSENILDKLVRLKDDFTFYNSSACDILTDENGNSEIDVDTVEKYVPGSSAGPEYHRRFEDYDSSKIDRFLQHVLWNIDHDKDGYRKETVETQLCKSVKDFDADDDSEETIDETELATSKLSVEDTVKYNVSPKVKEQLAYYMYRLNQLSARCRVNIFSMMIAHKLSLAKSSNGDSAKPDRLISCGVQSADMNGDCNGVLVDRYGGLTDARELIYNGRYGSIPPKYIQPYIADYENLSKLIDMLGIDIHSEHPEEYTHDFVKSIASGVIVDNYTYVMRAKGGYYKEVYNMLKDIPLDEACQKSVQKEINDVGEIVDIIESYAMTPSDVFDAVRKKYKGDPLRVAVQIQCAVAQASSTVLVPTAMDLTDQVDQNGFFLDDCGKPYFVTFLRPNPAEPDTGMKREWTKYTNGRAYFNVNGYVMFQPFIYPATGVCRRAVLVFKMEPFLEQIKIDGNNVEYQALGDEVEDS